MRYFSGEYGYESVRERTIWFILIAVVLCAFFIALIELIAWLDPEMRIGEGVAMVIGTCILGVSYAGSAIVVRRKAQKQWYARRFVDWE